MQALRTEELSLMLGVCTLPVLDTSLGSSFLIGTAMHMSGLYVVLHL